MSPPARKANPSCETRKSLDGDALVLLAGVGDRLRTLRRRRGYTLGELAARTGMSLSSLSRLESGKRRPTLDVLVTLAQLYETTLDELVGMAPRDASRRDRRPSSHDGVTLVPLWRRGDGLRVFKTVHPRAAPGGPIRQVSHPGTDWLFVLCGELRLTLGDREHVLRAGEAVEFDTGIPHGLASAGDEPVEVLNVMSPQGRRVRVREL